MGYLKKDDIVIGSDEVDKKFLTPCGKVYESYNECVRETNGNVFNCIDIFYIFSGKDSLKLVQKCEFDQGWFNYDID